MTNVVDHYNTCMGCAKRRTHRLETLSLSTPAPGNCALLLPASRMPPTETGCGLGRRVRNPSSGSASAGSENFARIVFAPLEFWTVAHERTQELDRIPKPARYQPRRNHPGRLSAIPEYSRNRRFCLCTHHRDHRRRRAARSRGGLSSGPSAGVPWAVNCKWRVQSRYRDARAGRRDGRCGGV